MNSVFTCHEQLVNYHQTLIVRTGNLSITLSSLGYKTLTLLLDDEVTIASSEVYLLAL